MRRESVEVGVAARQRLELLGRELGRSLPEPPEALAPRVVPQPGRHAHSSVALPFLARFSEQLSARLRLNPAHLAVVAVLAAAAVALVAWSVLRAAPKTIAAPPAVSGSTTRSDGPMLVSATPSGIGGGEVVIDVAGKVRSPGVATLPAGSRVIDALRHVGGARPGVDLSTLNLARLLVDGEQILVGVPVAPGRAPGAGSTPAAGALVSLNSATVEELEGLPGVGPVTASKIVAWRTEHGAFSAVDELLDVDGIGTKTLAELAPHVTL